MKRNPNFFINCSKRYNPTVVAQVLPSFDEHGTLLRISSDVHLIKYIHDYTLTRDSAEAYLASMNKASTSFDNIPTDKLRDVMPPRGVNNITDMYMYTRYLQKTSEVARNRFRDISEMFKDLHRSPSKSDSSKSDPSINS